MLDFDRFLNLVYYWVVRRFHDEKERRKFDRTLFSPPPGEITRAAETQGEYVPHWWRGDEVAGQQGLAIARAFGINVDLTAASV